MLGMAGGSGGKASLDKVVDKTETLFIWKWQRNNESTGQIDYTLGINGGGDPRTGWDLDPRWDGLTSEQADAEIQRQKDERPEVQWLVINI